MANPGRTVPCKTGLDLGWTISQVRGARCLVLSSWTYLTQRCKFRCPWYILLFTIHSLPYDLFIHGRLRLVKFARYSVVPPKTPQASKLPITLFPVDWSVCMLCAYWYSQNLNFLPFSIFKLKQSIDQMTEKLKRLAAQDIFTVDRLVCSFLSDASISKRE